MMAEILVIGGGLAGAAAAAHLARRGRDVLLLEREPGAHDKVCGEFLSYEAQDYLSQLEVDPAALGAVPVTSVAVERGRSRKASPLPFTGLSLSRRVLDAAVLQRAMEAGARVRRGVRATSLQRHGPDWAVSVEDGPSLTARHVFLATGKHDLRGWKRPPGTQSDLLGFKMYWRLHDPGPLDGEVELHLFPGGYAGLEMVEGERANLCLVVRKSTFSGLGGRWGGLLAHLHETCPGLAARLSRAVPCAAKPLAVAAIPYGLVQERSDGVWRLGDQAAVIPSFTGEGMSIALHSARLAAEFIDLGRDPQAFQQRLARDVRGQVRRATLASRALVAPFPQAVVGRMLSPPLMRLLLRETRIARAVRIEE
ncbi:MAG: FAD-dependent oxidoreductase [Proteobacteria bacterium]|nr:FAD-dependent oxidoreductase [Pseudomonadota bacterium]